MGSTITAWVIFLYLALMPALTDTIDPTLKDTTDEDELIKGLDSFLEKLRAISLKAAVDTFKKLDLHQDMQILQDLYNSRHKLDQIFEKLDGHLDMQTLREIENSRHKLDKSFERYKTSAYGLLKDMKRSLPSDQSYWDGVLQMGTDEQQPYTRWLSTSCDSDSSILYEGYMMVQDKVDDPYSDSFDLYFCQHADSNLKLMNDQHDHGEMVDIVDFYRHDDDSSSSRVPCRVCYIESETEHAVISGSDVCPSNWIIEYSGYLTLEHRSRGYDYRCSKEPYAGEQSGPAYLSRGYYYKIPCVVCHRN